MHDVKGDALSKKFVTMQFEVPDDFISDLQQIERDGALNALAECLATLEGRRVVGVECSD